MPARRQWQASHRVFDRVVAGAELAAAFQFSHRLVNDVNDEPWCDGAETEPPPFELSERMLTPVMDTFAAVSDKIVQNSGEYSWTSRRRPSGATSQCGATHSRWLPPSLPPASRRRNRGGRQISGEAVPLSWRSISIEARYVQSGAAVSTGRRLLAISAGDDSEVAPRKD